MPWNQRENTHFVLGAEQASHDQLTDSSVAEEHSDGSDPALSPAPPQPPPPVTVSAVGSEPLLCMGGPGCPHQQINLLTNTIHHISADTATAETPTKRNPTQPPLPPQCPPLLLPAPALAQPPPVPTAERAHWLLPKAAKDLGGAGDQPHLQHSTRQQLNPA